jgi:high-affinity iron transporter
VASIIIFIMGVTVLKMDRAKLKWRVKLQQAFNGKRMSFSLTDLLVLMAFVGTDRRASAGKWMLLILPLVTVLREGGQPPGINAIIRMSHLGT